IYLFPTNKIATRSIQLTMPLTIERLLVEIAFLIFYSLVLLPHHTLLSFRLKKKTGTRPALNFFISYYTLFEILQLFPYSLKLKPWSCIYGIPFLAQTIFLVKSQPDKNPFSM